MFDLKERLFDFKERLFDLKKKIVWFNENDFWIQSERLFYFRRFMDSMRKINGFSEKVYLIQWVYNKFLIIN